MGRLTESYFILAALNCLRKILIHSKAVFRRYSVKKKFWQNFCKIHRKSTCAGASFLNLRFSVTAALLIKRLRLRSFPVNFAEILKTLICRTFANEYLCSSVDIAMHFFLFTLFFEAQKRLYKNESHYCFVLKTLSHRHWI